MRCCQSFGGIDRHNNVLVEGLTIGVPEKEWGLVTMKAMKP